MTAHAALMRRAAVLMPHLDADDQRRLRIAMLAGVGGELRQLVSKLNLMRVA